MPNNNDRDHQNTNGGHSSTCQVNTSRGGRGGRGRGSCGHGGRGNNNSEQLKNIECFNCGKRATLQLTAQSHEKMTMNIQTWYPSRISKNLFQSSFKEMLTKKEKQEKKKENTEGDDDYLNMNIF
jgi:hypothetical protein